MTKITTPARPAAPVVAGENSVKAGENSVKINTFALRTDLALAARAALSADKRAADARVAADARWAALAVSVAHAKSVRWAAPAGMSGHARTSLSIVGAWVLALDSTKLTTDSDGRNVVETPLSAAGIASLRKRVGTRLSLSAERGGLSAEQIRERLAGVDSVAAALDALRTQPSRAKGEDSVPTVKRATEVLEWLVNDGITLSDDDRAMLAALCQRAGHALVNG